MKLIEFKMLAVGNYDKVWEKVFEKLREYFGDSWEVEEGKDLDYGFQLPPVTDIEWERNCIQNYIAGKLNIPPVFGSRVFYITREHESAYHNKLKTTVKLSIIDPEVFLRYQMVTSDVYENYNEVDEYVKEEADWYKKLKELRDKLFPLYFHD